MAEAGAMAQLRPSTVVLQLARNPGTPFTGGDRSRGYVITAPLTPDDHIDAAALHGRRWPVRRYGDEGDGDTGWLARRGEAWFIDYDRDSDADDEPIFRLGDHRFVVGEYLTITDEHRQPLTYRVVDVSRWTERQPPT
jgi:hypothetical protein